MFGLIRGTVYNMIFKALHYINTPDERKVTRFLERFYPLVIMITRILVLSQAAHKEERHEHAKRYGRTGVIAPLDERAMTCVLYNDTKTKQRADRSLLRYVLYGVDSRTYIGRTMHQ